MKRCCPWLIASVLVAASGCGDIQVNAGDDDVPTTTTSCESNNDCDDGLDCTQNFCQPDKTCGVTVKAGTCYVDGACYEDGWANPGNLCQRCDPASPNFFTDKECQGRSCDPATGMCLGDVPDAGTPDAGTPDAETPDAGTPDAGTPDAGTPDAETPDAGTPDAGTPDAETPDAGTPDAETPDAGTPDAETPDAGTPDAETPDAGTPDAGPADVTVDVGPTCDDAACAATAGTCEVAACVDGACVVSDAPDDTGCDDGDPCTTDDVCASGTCGGAAKVCDDGDACNGLETCSASDGHCVAGTPVVCDDGDACNGVETCVAATGQCQAGVPVVCDDGDACNGVETCVAATGQCQAGVPVVCDDGDACNGVETCTPTMGQCQAGVPVVCDDGDACNGVETCNPSTGACNAGTPVVCDDGVFCNGVETCNPSTGTCDAGTPVNCAEDALGCTTVFCDEANNTCAFNTNAGTCLVGGACYGPGDADPADGCAVCDSAVAQDAFVTAPAGTSCGLCALCDEAGACSVDDPTCCRSSDSDGYWGMCGHTADVLMPDGCEYTISESRSGFGSSSGWHETYGCSNGTWTEIGHNGGGGPSSSPIEYHSSWTDTCGGLIDDDRTCTDACRTADAPNNHGYCADNSNRYLPSGCIYINDSYSRSTGGYGWSTNPYQCVDGAWVDISGSGGGGPCPGCAPLWRNTWSDDCGNSSANVIECDDNCPTWEAPNYGGYCEDGKAVVLRNDCTYTNASSSSSTTSSGGGSTIYDCVDGVWTYNPDSGGGGGPCSGCTPFYQNTWSDDCEGGSDKHAECTVLP